MTGMISWRRLARDGTEENKLERFPRPLTKDEYLEWFLIHKCRKTRFRYLSLRNLSLTYVSDNEEDGVADWAELLDWMAKWLDIAELEVEGLTCVNERGEQHKLCSLRNDRSWHLMPSVKVVTCKMHEKLAPEEKPRPRLNYVPPPVASDRGSIGRQIRQPRYRLREFGFVATGRSAVECATARWGDQVLAQWDAMFIGDE